MDQMDSQSEQRVQEDIPFCAYYEILMTRRELSSDQIIQHVTSPLHCPRCLFVFSSVSAFKQHNIACEAEDSENELKIENYYHPLCTNVPNHRCDILLDDPHKSNRINEPCLERLNDKNICPRHKTSPRVIRYSKHKSFFLTDQTRIYPYQAYRNLSAEQMQVYREKEKKNSIPKRTSLCTKICALFCY
jgi:hypothetical protein